MNKAVQNAKSAVDATQREIARITGAIDSTERQLEKLAGSLKRAPDRSGELSELMAAVALGEAYQSAVDQLAATIEKEKAATSKANASIDADIKKQAAVLGGLELRREKAEAAESAASRALHDAALSDIGARMQADSAALLKHLQAIGDLFPRLLSDAMLLDQTDGMGRFDIIRAFISVEVTDWPQFLAGSPTAEEIYAMTGHGANRAAHDKFQAAIAELAGIGVELRQ